MSNVKKAKEILKRLEALEKDEAFSGEPASIFSEGYFNPIYDPKYHRKRKKKNKRLLH